MADIKDYPPYLDYPKPRKTMTNADRIRAMSDEELADFLGQHCLCSRVQSESDWCEIHATCSGCLEEWMKQPLEE